MLFEKFKEKSIPIVKNGESKNIYFFVFPLNILFKLHFLLVVIFVEIDDDE